jgi:glycosyltransferase involved in cell wall biosynthesis
MENNNLSITYFHWAKNSGVSITRNIRPLIDKMNALAIVNEYYVPYSGSLPWNLIRNIYFVYKHRNRNGINHISGDIHYCVLGLLGCKSVLTIHDDYAIVKARRGILDKIFKWIFWLYLPIKLANKVVCISEATKIRIDKLVKNNKTKVLCHHSVDTEFKYVPRVFNADCPTILQIGATPQKNLETTLKALAGIKCKLRVVKKMTPEQHILAQSLKIDYTNVYDLSDSEIVNEYVNADIVVFPSLYEGFGVPIIEGQAVGRVVITSNIAPMNSVAGGVAVLLNDPLDVEEYRNAILYTIQDSSFREKIIEDGLKNAKKHTIEEIVKRYCDLYNDYDKNN